MPCTAKESHIFSIKNKCICNIAITLTDDVFNFEQLAPVCYILFQECEHYLDVFNITVMRQQAEVEVLYSI